jgi:hypothetical protein
MKKKPHLLARSAKVLGVFLTLAISSSSPVFALIAVPRDFPLETTNGEQTSETDRLATLVSFYRNDVVLLANPEEAFAKEIREATGTPILREKLKTLATAGGAELTADSISAAAAALVRQSPSEAPVIMASAMELWSTSTRKVSVDDRYVIARGAISGIPYEMKERPALIASIIGISALSLKQIASTDLVRRLREFAITDAPFGWADYKGTPAPELPAGDAPLTPVQSGFALALDEALVAAGILSPYAASPEFLAMANNFASDQLDETFFSGDQGVINQGAVFAPGSAGSAGGSGNSGNQPPPPAS